MQLIRGSLLHSFLTKGLFNKPDEYFQGLSGCRFLLAILDKLCGVAATSTSVVFVIIGLLLEVFGGLTGNISELPFILYISLVFFWTGVALAVLIAIVLCIIHFKPYKVLQKLPKTPKIDCGVVQVLDKRIEK